MAAIKGLNAHDRPPERIRDAYKKYQRLQLSDIDQDPAIIDLKRLDQDNLPDLFTISGSLSSKDLRLAFDGFIAHKPTESYVSHGGDLIEDVPIITHKRVTGLRMIPSLLPPTVQSKLLALMFHRDLSDPSHRTNLHLHYHIEYPKVSDDNVVKDEQRRLSPEASFFEIDPSCVLEAKDPSIHRSITVQNMLDKKLRWITLGGQYDWTRKVYPEGPSPPFPEDIARLLRAAFPETEAQAAIVNLYSPNDTLSMHRDVSEECDTGLISISIGCDGLFLVSHDDGEGCEVIRLRSGDAVYMSDRSRFAWHGVPKVIPETCPAWLREWPGPAYPYWQGWMSRKRINLNVRQMSDLHPRKNESH